MFLRRNFGSSRLVRLLGHPTSVEVDAPGQDLAERLSQWVGVFDAVKLHAAHQSIPAAAEEPATDTGPVRRAIAAALQAHCQQVRAVLVKGIKAGDEADAPVRRPRNPRSETQAEAEPAPQAPADHAAFRTRYLDCQRNMELMIGPLRAHVRQTLSEASPRLRRLAELDAVWEQMLEAREQNLLMTVPSLLKRRFEQLRLRHQHDDPVSWRQAGGWLEVFGREQQEVLLAELDVRLESVEGMMEALSNEVEKYQ